MKAVNESSLNKLEDIVSYTETKVGTTNDDIKIIVYTKAQDPIELVVERFSPEEINLLDKVLKKFKNKIMSNQLQANIAEL